MNNKLYVGNLSFDTGEETLRELFSQAGTIKSVTIPMDRMTNQPRGFAFVEMATPAEALKAIQLCDGRDCGGRTLRVNEAKPPENRMGAGTGGGGNERRSPRRY